MEGLPEEISCVHQCYIYLKKIYIVKYYYKLKQQFFYVNKLHFIIHSFMLLDKCDPGPKTSLKCHFFIEIYILSEN